jgi:hypothetical protein
MKNFSEQWKALKDKKGGGEPEVPKITKALPIIKWNEAYTDYTHRVIGVPSPFGLCHPTCGGCTSDWCTSCRHTAFYRLWIDRNGIHCPSLSRIRCSERTTRRYTIELEEATRRTSYAASIKPFLRTKNGTDAWITSRDGEYSDRRTRLPTVCEGYPVQKKRSDHAGGKRCAADISDTTGEEANAHPRRVSRAFSNELRTKS